MALLQRTIPEAIEWNTLNHQKLQEVLEFKNPKLFKEILDLIVTQQEKEQNEIQLFNLLENQNSLSVEGLAQQFVQFKGEDKLNLDQELEETDKSQKEINKFIFGILQ